MNKVTTTINTKRLFFRSKIRKNLVFLLLALQFTACVKNEKTFKTESFRTTSGYGYSIILKNKIIIRQSIIPVIGDTKSFTTEGDALKVADLVVKKLNQNISPTVTKNDLILLKIKL
ncbi:DUF4907 domain-containing protein [Flavobacterium psychroterrae]|uniref:DUF4907 domain-containing protein n=1 Tax=Flavobacterium psychroterrae TaxID=2133767 RepID=A0ABS5P8N6_9FLAO|nr:DUF4907 domain-containing protein [Flavobacterium psychroterrae]